MRDGVKLLCFFRPEGNSPVEVKELHDHCRANLSPQKTPTVWRQVESIPMTGSGKVQKFMLRDQFMAGEYEEAMP